VVAWKFKKAMTAYNCNGSCRNWSLWRELYGASSGSDPRASFGSYTFCYWSYYILL